MTLNITVLTRKSIYQSADYRLTDTQAGRATDFQTQKIFVVNAFEWSATVCFTGVGRAGKVNVHEWVSEHLSSIQHNDPFERLVDELLMADRWLSRVPDPHNKHSFSVGAFLGAEPLFVLISNFERPSGHKLPRATGQLFVFEQKVEKPRVIIPGQTGAVTRLERKQLKSLAARDPAPQAMHSLLAEINRSAARRKTNISPACFTTHLRLTGEGDTRTHDVGNAPLPDAMPMPHELRRIRTQVADNQFGAGKWRINGISFIRAGASDEYHKTQLREKPNDPNLHSNYGVFLLEKNGDVEGAEREYRMALQLDPDHANSLGNLANLLSEKGDLDQAARLYRRALEVAPAAENALHNFARFLASKLDDRVAARDLLDKGIVTNPRSGRLRLLRGRLALEEGRILEALEDYRQARGMRVDQAKLDAGHAFALHMSNAPIDDCIAAYRTAIGLNPQVGALRLNLAQLLFLKDDGDQAEQNLDEALRLGLDDAAQLEALFYRLCHTDADVEKIFRETKKLLDLGARLCWNIGPNIQLVNRTEPQKVKLLQLISKVMEGEQDQSLLDDLISHWQIKGGR